MDVIVKDASNGEEKTKKSLNGAKRMHEVRGKKEIERRETAYETGEDGKRSEKMSCNGLRVDN